ncbi:MAG: protease modulator HflC [Planctomycetes bacterium]|nr:protease modulator HflC [Planctomycetota bacterium]
MSHDHGAGCGHDHHQHGSQDPAPSGTGGHWMRWTAACVLVLLSLLAATLVTVRAGTASVVTRFGDPVKVHVRPGLAWKAPAPLERTIDIDLRLHTTASGIHGVLTRDGLSVVVQAHVAWRVPAEPERVLRFLRASSNNPDEAAGQLRTFLGSALETVSARFELASLVNTDPAQVRLDQYEAALKERLESQVRDMWGIEVVQVGIERLMLPDATLSATIQRMSAERDTVAEARKSEGKRIAGEIRSQAEKEARILKAKASEEAGRTEAAARAEAAIIYGRVHAADPQLYEFLRSLDTLEQAMTGSTHLVLRTDAAPFRALVEALPAAAATGAAAGK